MTKVLVIYFHRLLLELTLIRNAPSLEMCPSEAGFCPVSLCSLLATNYKSFVRGADDVLSHDGLLNPWGFEDNA